MGKPEVDSSDDEEDLAKDQQPKANPIRWLNDNLSWLIYYLNFLINKS
jgi:hypothetical protein